MAAREILRTMETSIRPMVHFIRNAMPVDNDQVFAAGALQRDLFRYMTASSRSLAAPSVNSAR